MCCSSNLLGKQFSDLIDSFNITQFVCDTTHRHGHTLDLVLSMGLSISEVFTEDYYISDHRPVFFNFDLPASVSKSQSADCYFRPINESTANCFAEAYVKSPVSSIIEASGPSLDTE